MSVRGSTTATTAYHAFANRPQVVGPRRKYRWEDSTQEVLGTRGTIPSGMAAPTKAASGSGARAMKGVAMMWSQRVHRGPPASVLSYSKDPSRVDPATIAREAEKRREEARQAKKRLAARSKKAEKSPFATPMPDPPRFPVDLMPHLVEQTPRAVHRDNVTQIDEFLPQPPAQPYRPAKTGIDNSTQIKPTDLFHFDREVEPILDVIINKTLEQAQTEVEEEEEMKSLLIYKEEWRERKVAVLKEQQKEVERERKRMEEKNKLMDANRKRVAREKEAMRKVEALEISNRYLRDLADTALTSLAKSGAFPDPVEIVIEQTFLPWVVEECERHYETLRVADTCVANAIESAMEESLRRTEASRQEQVKIFEDFCTHERDRRDIPRGNMRIKVKTESGETVVIGPVKVHADEPMSDVNLRVMDWINTNQPELAEAFPHGVILNIDDKPAEETNALFATEPGQLWLSAAPEPPPPPIQEEEAEPVEGKGEGEREGEGEGVEGRDKQGEEEDKGDEEQ
ncbi:unnamed protein product [Vitrella brassicaformis CCMP3155]|uniref:Uncharacterized protein n=1 Tax=Vitrella brassicaformis (strain CCMP3155) TaxID=1169540 RepID=A0A0G4GRM6_VITBC|nr:unnamed protein product [Vitrella brassicaformis CCMP3155]|eukprot:CEM33003.1 unnamed protein product [Vitrella brassicaformis CCMP3155]